MPAPRVYFVASIAALLAAAALTWAAMAAENDPVVATVNGEKIFRSHVIEAKQLLPVKYHKVPLDQMFPALVDSIIDTKLAAADARTRKLHEDGDFRARMDRIEEQLLQRIVLQQEMNREITEDALRDRYKRMVDGFESKEEVHARHILLKTEEDAKAVIVKLDKGSDFPDLAKEKSTGPSGPNGGDLGFFGRGQMVPEFEKVAFDMETGKHSWEPVKTQFGFHVIKIEARRKAEVPSFDKVADQLRGEISQERGTTYVAKLRKTAAVKRFSLDGKPLAEKKDAPKNN